MALLPPWICKTPKMTASAILLLERFVVVSKNGTEAFSIDKEVYAKTFGMPTATVSKSIKRLIKLGFLEMVTPYDKDQDERYYNVTQKTFGGKSL